MWTIKIALLAAGVTMTAFMSNSSADDVSCAVAYETSGGMAPAADAASDQRDACLPRE
jgi:hypothetical protein